MGPKTKLILLIVACCAIIGAVKVVISLPPGPDPTAALAVAESRLDAIEAALRTHADGEGGYPPTDEWLEALGLSEADLADPFAIPPDGAPLNLWTDGQWYVITSLGPDAAIAERAQSQSLDPGVTLASAQDFAISHFAHRNPDELEALLGEGGLIGDIRFRGTIYDPTNGLRSWGDVVRWGGPAGS